MRITRRQLRQIIREELSRATGRRLNEAGRPEWIVRPSDLDQMMKDGSRICFSEKHLESPAGVDFGTGGYKPTGDSRNPTEPWVEEGSSEPRELSMIEMKKLVQQARDVGVAVVGHRGSDTRGCS